MKFAHFCMFIFVHVGVQPPLGWITGGGLPNLEGAIAFYRIFFIFLMFIFFILINHTYMWIKNMLDCQNKLLKKYFS